MYTDGKSLKDLFDALDVGSQYLRDRRMFAEADAVKFARDILLQEAYEMLNNGENEEIHDVLAKKVAKPEPIA